MPDGMMREFVVVGLGSRRFGVGGAGRLDVSCLDLSDSVSVSSRAGSFAKELVAVRGLVVDVAGGEMLGSVRTVLSLSLDWVMELIEGGSVEVTDLPISSEGNCSCTSARPVGSSMSWSRSRSIPSRMVLWFCGN